MAPDATLSGYAAGDAIAVFSFLTAFDDIPAAEVLGPLHALEDTTDVGRLVTGALLQIRSPAK